MEALVGWKHWLDGSIGRTVYLEWKVLHCFLSRQEHFRRFRDGRYPCIPGWNGIKDLA
jgi:hypothetical protein